MRAENASHGPHEVVVNLIGASISKLGPKVHDYPDTGSYPKDIELTNKEVAAVPLLPTNFTATGTTRSTSPTQLPVELRHRNYDQSILGRPKRHAGYIWGRPSLRARPGPQCQHAFEIG